MKEKGYVLVIIFTMLANLSHATLELIQDPTTHLRVSPFFNPTVQEQLFDNKPLFPEKVAWAFGLGVEIPILQWLNSGIILQFSTGLPDIFPVIDLSWLAKFQIPIPVLDGNVTPYVMLPLGFTYANSPVIDMVPQRFGQAEGGPFKSYATGFGFNGTGYVGIEFFPIRYIGIFAEGGYRATVIFHQIVKGEKEERTWQYASYWIHGPTVSFGAKIAF